jgi:hypothetical protein
MRILHLLPTLVSFVDCKKLTKNIRNIQNIQNIRNIQNIDLPSCKNCIYFDPQSHSDFTSTLSKCNKFGHKNIISDEITYDYASSCRNDENKCGEKGVFFVNEPNIKFKIFKHLFHIIWDFIFLLYSFLSSVLFLILINP